MIAKCVLLSLLVAAATASPVLQDSGIVGYKEALDMFLDAWKNMIPCGFPADNIPPMAPLKVDFYPFKYVNGETNLVGNLSNIRISGLNKFEVLSGSYDNNTLHATFDVMYPEIQILGSYEVEGVLSVGGLPLPIRQSVLINKKISNWRFVGAYSFAKSLTSSKGLRITDLELQYYVSSVQSANWDKYMDIASNNFFNKFIESFSMLFTEEIQAYVVPLRQKYLLPFINDMLSKVDMTELTNYFVMQAGVWNEAACNVKA